jgi:beta-galactosidase
MNILCVMLAAAGFAADWTIGPVAEPTGKVDVETCISEPSAWNEKKGALGGKIVQAKGAAQGNSKDGVYNCWYKKSVDVPADWKGRSVRFEADLNWCDLVVFVNGRKAGVAYDPDGSVELASFLTYGAPNEIKVFATNRGWGTGEHGVKYWGRGDMASHHFGGPHIVSGPALNVRSAAYVDNAYARASWRGTEVGSGKWDGKKKVTMKVEVESVAEVKADIAVRFYADAGNGGSAPVRGPNVVKEGKKTVSLKKGANLVEFDIPWEDVRCWELVPNAACYVCSVEMTAGGETCDSRQKDFLFGFREIWREGKEFVLNGHLQRFRGYWNQGDPKDMNDLHKYGYNLSYETHKHWVIGHDPEGKRWAQARAGIAVFSGMPSIYFVHDEIRKNPDTRAQWHRFLKRWMRETRNMPSIVATSCGVNQICPERNMRPEILGQDPEKGGVVDNIEYARAEARKFHPNCLYFSHADGTEADISSSNLYFNFTPLQEREEWLSSWAENGTLPWYAAEFGAPYYACWFHSRTPQMTEWLAAYYGEAAYEAEDPAMLYYNKAFAKDCLAKTHGGWVNNWNDQLFSFNALGRRYSKMLVYRTNRAWRTFGQNGGIMYLENWNWDMPNEVRERQIQANGDLVTWLAGGEKITDRTHAFRSGETIARQLVAVWDGFGEKRVTADWKFVEANGGKVVASGQETFSVNQGDVAKKPISVVAPKVKKVAKYRFEVTFASDVDRERDYTFATVENDSFDVEVYPAFADAGLPSRPGEIALFDPEGETAKTLAALGAAFKTYETLESALADKSVRRLVVGRRALGKACGLEKAEPRIAEGLKVLVMPQTADVWQIMGFQVEDMMPREMRNVALPDLDDAALAHWRGLPKWEKDYGLVMKHDTRRGPRWMHTHAVAGLALLIPQRAGAVPLVRGEFDLSYTTLLKIVRGKGSATFCTFDFEDRVGRDGCPAATETARAMMKDFLADDAPAGKKVFADGDEAKRLAKTLGLEAEDFAGRAGDNALVIAGRDAKSDYKKIAGALGQNAHAYIFANSNLAAQAGLRPSPAKMKVAPKKQVAVGKKTEWQPVETEDDVFVVRDRTGWDKFPFAGVGPQHLRFRDRLQACKYEAAGKFRTTGSGLFATDGRVLFDAIDPYQICDRYRQGKDGQASAIKAGGWGKVPAGERDLYLRTTAQTEDNQMRRLSLVFANLGVGAGKAVLGRALYTKPVEAYTPLAQFNVLGPWPSKNDDSAYMVDTKDFPVEPDSDNKGSVAEEMAIRGDVQPNPRFRPLGLAYLDSVPHDLRFLDWRPVVKPDENGLADLRKLEMVAAQSFNTCYCVGFLERETDGEITLRFGVDWRGAVWVNGQEILRTHGGTKDEGSIVKTGIKVWAMPKGKTPSEIHALDKERGTFDGKNVITVKAGSGQSASTFYLRVSKEVKPGDVKRVPVKELDDVKLYPTPNPDFDPYEYVYW